MPSLEERVAELERIARAPAPELAADTYMVVNPDGSITFDFAGHIHAQGLDLDAGTTGTPPDQDRIRWLRTSDGAVVASEFANELGPGPNEGFRTWGTTVEALAGKRASALLQAISPDHSTSATVQAGYNDATSVATASAIAGIRAATIIDSNQRSTFAQGGQEHTVSWPGGNNRSTQGTFAHGLAFTPAHVYAAPHGTMSSGAVSCVSYLDADGTNVVCEMSALEGVPAAGVTQAVAFLFTS